MVGGSKEWRWLAQRRREVPQPGGLLSGSDRFGSLRSLRSGVRSEEKENDPGDMLMDKHLFSWLGSGRLRVAPGVLLGGNPQKQLGGPQPSC